MLKFVLEKALASGTIALDVEILLLSQHLLFLLQPELSTGDLRFLTDLLTFYGRKVGKFTAVNRPIYGDLFTGSRYKKRRKLRSVAVKIRKTQ